MHFCLSEFSAMVPEYWLTEGGQSATGALLDHIIENHAGSIHLANRAASQSKVFSPSFGFGIYQIYINDSVTNVLTRLIFYA